MKIKHKTQTKNKTKMAPSKYPNLKPEMLEFVHKLIDTNMSEAETSTKTNFKSSVKRAYNVINKDPRLIITNDNDELLEIFTDAVRKASIPSEATVLTNAKKLVNFYRLVEKQIIEDAKTEEEKAYERYLNTPEGREAFMIQYHKMRDIEITPKSQKRPIAEVEDAQQEDDDVQVSDDDSSDEQEQIMTTKRRKT